MELSLKTLLPWIIAIVLSGLVIKQPEFIFSPVIEREVVTDSVFVDRPFEVTRIDTKEVEVPKRVTTYKTRYDTIRTVEVKRDTVFIEVDDRTIVYDPRFLTNFTSHPKFLELELSYDRFSIAGLFPSGETLQNEYDTDLSRYRYTLGITDGGNFGLNRERLSFRESFMASFYHNTFIGYDMIESTPVLQYRAGFENIINNFGIESEIELSNAARARIGIHYNF